MMNRRRFLSSTGAGLAALPAAPAAAKAAGLQGATLATGIDFRYAPLEWQTAFCFPDDAFKSLVGERGDLRYGYARGLPIDRFGTVIEFAMLGMEHDTARQTMEAPGIPIVHTQLARADAVLHLTTFATNESSEGRVDNVILEVVPLTSERVHVSPAVFIRTGPDLKIAASGDLTVVYAEGRPEAPVMIADRALEYEESGRGSKYYLEAAAATADRPLRCFFRFPQQQQSRERLMDGLRRPGGLLASARGFWREWRPYGGSVDWQLPTPYHHFLTACAQNIQQAREMRKGQLTFQVGPTCYRGLWVVDGNFILEAARYLGYDQEVQKGLETTWAYQQPNGAVIAGGGAEHWKDTGIAMFTLVRQAELSQDWSYFRAMQGALLKAADFLSKSREKAVAEGTANGKYGLLARGFGDGGLEGLRDEFTNTIWALAGLRATVDAAEKQQLSGFEPIKNLYGSLREAFFASARQEMRKHPDGFEFLPMLMKNDPQWNLEDELRRPRPQIAQWALSHAIYPGLVFEKDDPVVRGHIRLMQAVTREDIPAETGWIHHGGAWNYNAPFVSHVYLWANEPEWARLAFHGFLNHASPLYCWREEQPLRNSLTARYVGDMPHNWASAECVLYLRHMLALEDGPDLRLLPGFGDLELSAEQAYSLSHSPTRFGRVDLRLEPLARRRGWRMEFRRANGPAARSVMLPASPGSRLRISRVEGAGYKQSGETLLLDPKAASWTATWEV